MSATRAGPNRPGSWHRGYGPTLFVGSVLLFMLLTVLACIALYGRNVPLAEDWHLVAPLTGNEPDLFAWVWAQNNEHRVPLSRLVYLVLLEASEDFRIGMVANALILAALSVAMIWTAARLRGGRIRYTDAFFPILLLHLGNWENLLWGWQLQFVIATVVICVPLLVMVRYGARPSPPAAVAAAVSLVLLPLTGANGLVFAGVLAPWFAYTAWVDGRSGGDPSPAPRWTRVLLLGAAAGALLLCGLYFVGYQRTTWYPPSPSPMATLKTALKFAALGFGPAASHAWALSALASVAVVLAGGFLLLPCLRRAGPERQRAIGLLVFIGGYLALALLTAWGRAGSVPRFGMPARYTMLTVPLLCAVYLIAVLRDTRRASSAVQIALFGAMILLLPLNTREGLHWRNYYVGGMQALERDLADNVPYHLIAERHQPFLLHWNREFLLSRIRMLHEAGIGPFR